jgi:hypothetical protein
MGRLQELINEIESRVKNDPYYQTETWADDKGEVFETFSQYDIDTYFYVDSDDEYHPDDLEQILYGSPVKTKILKNIQRWEQSLTKGTGWKFQSIETPYKSRGICTYCPPHKGCNRKDWRIWKDYMSWKDKPRTKKQKQFSRIKLMVGGTD